jgi:hypothetical protein
MKRGFVYPAMANSQNSRVWSATNPHESDNTPLYDEKVDMLCAISRNWIIGPLFVDITIKSE